MRKKRLGKFRFSDYYATWFSIVMLLLFSTASALFELSFLFVVFPLVYAIIWLGVILVPYSERFSINSDSITVFRGSQSKTIPLPLELILVVSHADVCPPLAIRTPIGNQTHVLKNKFAVSILQNIQVTDALKSLHQNRIQMYTTSSIKTIFDDYSYVYSFVCDQLLLDDMLASRKVALIVPESLLKLLAIESSTENLYVVVGH